MFTDAVTIVVGNESGASKIFTVHKALLCHHSSFFEAACKGNFKESFTNQIHLPEDEPIIFDDFLQWLYLGAIDETIDVGYTHWWDRVIKLHILGDKLRVIEFQNFMIDLMKKEVVAQFKRKDRVLPTWDRVAAVYDATTAASELRRLIVTIFAYQPQLPTFKSVLPQDFLFDVLTVLKDDTPVPHRVSQQSLFETKMRQDDSFHVPGSV